MRELVPGRFSGGPVRRLRSVLVLVLAGALTALMGGVLVAPQASAAGRLAVTPAAPTVTARSATVSYTVNRGTGQLRSVACSLTLAGARTASTCGSPVSTGASTSTYRATFTHLALGTYQYQVVVRSSDGQSATGRATFTIVNTPPVVADDAYGVVAATVLDVPAGQGVLANDTDADADPLTATLVTGPAHGTLGFYPDGSFQYTPNTGYSGTDSFTYTASDGMSSSAPATVLIGVAAGAVAPPVAADDSYTFYTDQGPNIAVSAPGVLANDRDYEGLPVTAVLVTRLSKAPMMLNADGSFSFLIGSGYTGTDTFTYKAVDSQGNVSRVATVTVTVSVRPNAAPVATDDAYAVGRRSGCR